MGKVLPFQPGKTIEEWAEEIKQSIIDVGKTVAVAIDDGDGVLTAYFNCNFTNKVVLAQHLTFDAIHESLTASFEMKERED